jgi:hypothetical protein
MTILNKFEKSYKAPFEEGMKKPIVVNDIGLVYSKENNNNNNYLINFKK